MPYYVYILLCQDESYYTGYTKNPKRRIKQHKKGQGSKYTRTHKIKKIVYLEKFRSLNEALKREHKIKTLSHKEKQQLIENQQKHRKAPQKL